MNISTPLIYGEGERAFRRSQEEILRVHNDDALFAWSKPTNQNDNVVFIWRSQSSHRQLYPDVEEGPRSMLVSSIFALDPLDFKISKG
jgi:hypothetical protein